MCVQLGMDQNDREAIHGASYDPDDPAVANALDLVKRALRLHRHLAWTFTADDLDGHRLPR